MRTSLPVLVASISIVVAGAAFARSPLARADEPAATPRTSRTFQRFQGLSDSDPTQDVDCTWITEYRPYGYCVTRTEGSTNPDVLYYMHGAGGEQTAWRNEQKRIWSYWAKNGIAAPTVVTVSFGPIFLLAQKNGSAASGLLQFIAGGGTVAPGDSYMDKIEGEIGGVHGRRLLVGESMGGFNAIQLAMKYPRLFAKAAILCPDVTSLTPYASSDEIDDFMDSTGTNWFRTFWEIVMDRIFFADDGSWNQASPLLAGPEFLGPQTPPLYISGGEQDEFGFFPGTEAFAQIAKTRGVDAQWAPVPGPHCSYDIEGASRFLTE